MEPVDDDEDFSCSAEDNPLTSRFFLKPHVGTKIHLDLVALLSCGEVEIGFYCNNTHVLEFRASLRQHPFL